LDFVQQAAPTAAKALMERREADNRAISFVFIADFLSVFRFIACAEAQGSERHGKV